MKNPEKFEIKEEKEKHYQYDAVILLSGGLKKTKSPDGKEKFYPTDYRDSDEYGMLGAGMRMAALIDLYLNGEAKNIVFTTGKTEKMKEKHGEEIPSEAEIYKDKFLRVLGGLKKRSDYREKFDDLEDPDITLEDKSVSTLTNMEEIINIIKDNGWEKVALVSSGYHIPRVKALFEKILEEDKDFKVELDFMSAEERMKETQPGKYDDVIKEAYQTEHAQKRLKSEERGLKDVKEDTYSKQEFQFEEKNRGKE